MQTTNGQGHSSGLRMLAAVLALGLAACTSSSKTDTASDKAQAQVQPVNTPAFNADSSYQYVAAQLAFGPRVILSAGHQRCGTWLVAQLKGRGLHVVEQTAAVKSTLGPITLRNILASYKPERTRRIVISAHWDTRHVADQDSNKANHKKPVMGANDGASGVGVILEIARQLQANDPGVGVDLFLWDAEDSGENGNDASWCLGSTHWAREAKKNKYKADFGILLDMVGAADAQFTQDEHSRRYAATPLKLVWQTAHRLGYGQYFLFAPDGALIDDHVPMNEIAGVPTIDIIHRDLGSSSFFKHWHTLQDDLPAINKTTLKAVGQTLLEVLWQQGALLNQQAAKPQ